MITRVIPDLDALPLVGCLAVRLEEKSFRPDQKLDAMNQPGVFVGFANLRNTYGSVEQSQQASTAREDAAAPHAADTIRTHRRDSVHGGEDHGCAMVWRRPAVARASGGHRMRRNFLH